MEAMGFGDVVLMAMIGSFVGWQGTLAVFILAPLLAVLGALATASFRLGDYIPFGPYLSLATLLVLQYDVHPFVGLSFGPITFLICVLGGLGNFIGGFVAAFLFAEIISLGGLFSDLEWGYVLAFAFFILMMFVRPAGLLARRS